LCVPVPPARNPVSNIILVKNFVRPFTVPSAKAMLEEAAGGALADFWMNPVRSHCFATVPHGRLAEPKLTLYSRQFASKELAVAAREAVYDMVWPAPPTGRKLHAEFATEAEAKAAANGVPITQATHRRQNEPAAPRDDKANRREERQEKQTAPKKGTQSPLASLQHTKCNAS
jgi:hypothetical protein